MNSNSKFDLLFDLQNEIHRLDNMALYYTNLSLRKQAALAELIESWTVQEEREKVKLPPATPPPFTSSCVPTFVTMVREVVNGQGLSSKDIRRLVDAHYPSAVKYSNQIHTAVHWLRERGELVKEGKLYRRR